MEGHFSWFFLRGNQPPGLLVLSSLQENFLRPAAHDAGLRRIIHAKLSPTIGSLLDTILILSSLNAEQTLFTCYYKDSSRFMKCQPTAKRRNAGCSSFVCASRKERSLLCRGGLEARPRPRALRLGSLTTQLRALAARVPVASLLARATLKVAPTGFPLLHKQVNDTFMRLRLSCTGDARCLFTQTNELHPETPKRLFDCLRCVTHKGQDSHKLTMHIGRNRSCLTRYRIYLPIWSRYAMKSVIGKCYDFWHNRGVCRVSK